MHTHLNKEREEPFRISCLNVAIALAQECQAESRTAHYLSFRVSSGLLQGSIKPLRPGCM